MEKAFLISISLLLLQMQFVLSDDLTTAEGKDTSNLNLMPIKKIPGTNLYTGIFYKVGMKSFPQGWVTSFSDTYLEIEINPNDLPNYAPGGSSQYDNQWVFGASEISNAFTLANRGKPLGLLTWDDDSKVENGYYVYIETTSVRKLYQGGDWRSDALWAPIATEEKDMYKVTLKQRPNEFLCWAWAMSNDYNYYLKLAPDAQEDSKFSFKRSNFQLEALIHDFEFEHPLEYIIENRKRNRQQENITFEYKIGVPNPNSHSIQYFVIENVQSIDQIAIFFDQTFNTLTKTTVSINGLTPNVPTKFSFQSGFEANNTIAVEVRKTIPAKKKINLPPKNKRKVSVCTEWANDIEMPFNAKMTVTGMTERMEVNRVNSTVEGPIPGGALKDMLSISNALRDDEVIHESEKELVVLVSGVLKGNIAINSFVGSSLGVEGCCQDEK